MTVVSEVAIPIDVVWRYAGTTKAAVTRLLHSLALDGNDAFGFSQVCAVRAVVDHEKLLRQELPAEHRAAMFSTVASSLPLQRGYAPVWMLYGRRSGQVYLEERQRDLEEPNVQTHFVKFVFDPVRYKWEQLTGETLEPY
jgi:hypothetical protein